MNLVLEWFQLRMLHLYQKNFPNLQCSTIQKHIIISEKQKTKQKYYQQNIESHTEKKQKLFKQEQAKSIPIYILFV